MKTNSQTKAKASVRQKHDYFESKDGIAAWWAKDGAYHIALPCADPNEQGLRTGGFKYTAAAYPDIKSAIAAIKRNATALAVERLRNEVAISDEKDTQFAKDIVAACDASVEPQAAHTPNWNNPTTAQDHIRDLHDAATRFEDRAKRAERQRDALLAACKSAAAAMSQTIQFTTVSQRRRVDSEARALLSAAIAQAEGK